MTRQPVQRDWTAARQKVEDEGCCRNCKRAGGRLEAAHTLGREYDVAYSCFACKGTGEGQRRMTRCGRCKGRGIIMRVDPLLIIPLCGPATSTGTCHGMHHARRLDLLPILTGDEQVAAVAAIVKRAKARGGGQNVGIAEAYRRLSIFEQPEPGLPFEPPPQPDEQLSAYDIITGTDA